MALSNVLLLSQITGHITALVLSLCVIVPMCLHNAKFNDHCLLFAKGMWDGDDGLFHIESTSGAYCNFPIVTCISVCLISLAQIYRFSRIAVYKKEDTTTFLGLFIDVCFGTIMFIMVIISAFFITLGFLHWCSDMTLRFQTCGIAAGLNITQAEMQIDTSGFYVMMGTAQFGIWGVFASCVMICVVAYLKLISDHQMQNMKVSMFLERQRLTGDASSLVESLNSVSAEASSSSPQLQPEEPYLEEYHQNNRREQEVL